MEFIRKMLAVRIKIMPKSPEVDLEKLEKECGKVIEGFEGKVHSCEKEPIAFGLTALIFTLLWPDEGTDKLEEELGKVEDVNSVQLIDVRRAVG